MAGSHRCGGDQDDGSHQVSRDQQALCVRRVLRCGAAACAGTVVRG